jgi:hypothetical protein
VLRASYFPGELGERNAVVCEQRLSPAHKFLIVFFLGAGSNGLFTFHVSPLEGV